MTKITKIVVGLVAVLLMLLAGNAQNPTPGPQPQALLKDYCAGCHNQTAKTGGLSFDALDVTSVGRNPEVWEKVVRKIRSGMMPPSGARRPGRAALDAFAADLEDRLDRAMAAAPNPGSPGLHRLNRTEYANAI